MFRIAGRAMSNVIEATSMPDPAPARFAPRGGDAISEELAHLPILVRYGGAAFLVAIATLTGMAFEQVVSGPNLTLLFVIPVILTATMFGWGPSMFSVMAGVLAFDYFFTEPKFSFAINSASDIWAAALLLVTATVVSTLAAQTRQRAEEARAAAVRAQALQALAHRIVEGRPGGDIIQAAALTLNRLFEAPAVVLVRRGDAIEIAASAGAPTLTIAEEEAAREALASQIMTRAMTYPFVECRFDLWPVADRTESHCVLGVDFTRARHCRPVDPERFVEVVAGYLAVVFRGRVEI
jgi:K+-sensing histidine kinase KdpD